MIFDSTFQASNSLTSLTDPCQYTLEMENSRNQFQVVYTGTSVSHKISKLVIYFWIIFKKVLKYIYFIFILFIF